MSYTKKLSQYSVFTGCTPTGKEPQAFNNKTIAIPRERPAGIFKLTACIVFLLDLKMSFIRSKVRHHMILTLRRRDHKWLSVIALDSIHSTAMATPKVAVTPDAGRDSP